jgi:hypothetical protein
MRKSHFLLLCFVLLVGSLAAAQTPDTVTRVFYLTPKVGMEAQFEKALKAHSDFHRQKKDTWRWDVRYTETGSRTGEYIAITGGHSWKDFDNPPISPADDVAHFSSTVGPYVASWSSVFLVMRPDLSRSAPDAPLPPISVVTFFHLKYGQMAKFVDAIRKIKEAQDKTDGPIRASWFQLSGGGRNTVFGVSSPRENWAAFDMSGPSLRERVEKVFGRAGADAIYQALEESVAFTEVKITSARPDLSYVP